MDISLQSLLFFIIITIIYYAFPGIGKPSLTVADLESPELQADYHSKVIKSLVFYLSMVVASQFFLNIGYLIAKCGGSISKNIGSAAIFTFIPWILIFGVLLAVLLIFPGFKGAFSDVIGYYVVAGKANNILTSILKTTDFDEVIKNTSSSEEKEKLSKTADALTKILGNKGILINQMKENNSKKSDGSPNPSCDNNSNLIWWLNIMSMAYQFIIMFVYLLIVLWIHIREPKVPLIPSQ
jgi:hypothetical protein